MRRTRHVLPTSCVLLLSFFQGLASAQDVQPEPPRPIVRDVQVTGAKELGRNSILRTAHVTVGRPLPADPSRISLDIEERYHDDGYTFAHATAAFDEGTGLLSLTIDEGVIDAIEFEGIGQRAAHAFMDQ